MSEKVEIVIETIQLPKELNLIFGQSHFIKTVEDLYEAIINTVGNAKFGIAFCEASGPCLVRYAGNDDALMKTATENMLRIGAGHSFLILMENCFPINILPAIRECREVVNIFCATANPVQVVLAETAQGRGVLGVIDGYSPKGIETDKEIKERHSFLRKIGYKS